MPSARISSSAILAIALISIAIGVGFGFVLAPVTPALTVEAAAPLLPRGPAPSASTTTPATGPRLSAPAEREAAGLDAAPKTEVSAARLNDAKSRIDLPSASLSTTGFGGDGEISGTVVDDNGAPVPNITIIAHRSELRTASGRSTDDVGAAAPALDSLEEALEQAAQRWASNRDKRARVSTDSQGRFQLSGLTNGRYRVNAFKAGWVFKATGQEQCYPGDVLTFRAAQVTPLSLVVKLPDGSVAEDALVECRFGNNTELSTWTPEEPTLRLSAPRLQIKVYAGLLKTRAYQRDTKSRYASEDITVDAEDLAGTVLEVFVEPRAGIHGSLDKEWDGEDGGYVTIATLENEADFNAEGPFENQNSQSVSSGDFLFLDLEEGLYVIGVQVGGGRKQELVNHQFVQVTDSLIEVDLSIPSPEVGDFVLVHCLDPKGQPLNGVRLSVDTTRENGNKRSSNVNSMQAADGTYWVRRDGMRLDDYDAWGPGVTAKLLGRSALYGTQSVNLTSGQPEAHLQFTNPVSLTVSIIGYEDLSYKDQVSIQVTEQNPEGRYPTVIAKTRSGNRRGSDPVISKSGTVTFASLAPGAYEVRLMKGGNWGGGDALSKTPVTLGATDSSAQLIPPLLHNLVVFAPGLAESSYLTLNPGGIEGGDEMSGMGYFGGRSSGANARLDSDKRATFKDLQPGLYTLRKGWDGEGIEVQIPSGDIVFEPKIPNVLQVAITDEKGELYVAGLRTGDAILSINGVDIVEKGMEEGAFEEFQKESCEVSLRRDGKVITVTVGKVTGQYWDAQSIGGVLVPGFE